MGAQIWSFFIAFLVIFVPLKGVYTSPLHGKNATDSESGKVIVNGNYNAVNLYPDKDVKTALSQMRDKLKSLEGRIDALEKPGILTVKLVALKFTDYW